LEEPTETPYGDRRAMVEDPWGNTWQIAKYGRERRRQMSAGILPAIKK
jgi:uncharacterized glyoxalase superfamily protein PhnB